MITKEEFFIRIEEQVKRCNLTLLTHKIFNLQHFDHQSIEEFYPQKNLLSRLLQYVILRQKASYFKDLQQTDILKLQSELATQLSIANFDILGNITSKSKIFIERILIVAFCLPFLAKNLRFRFSIELDPKEMFIILIFLASGKFVSSKAFELAKSRMRTQKTSVDRYSIFSTNHSLKQSNESTKNTSPSSTHLFKEELKGALMADKPVEKDQDKCKLFERRNGVQYRTKVLSTPHSKTIQLLREKSNRNELHQKKRIIIKVSQKNRVSLADNVGRQQIRVASKGAANYRTQFIVQNSQLKQNFWEKKTLLSVHQYQRRLD